MAVFLQLYTVYRANTTNIKQLKFKQVNGPKQIDFGKGFGSLVQSARFDRQNLLYLFLEVTNGVLISVSEKVEDFVLYMVFL